ncbi:MAG: 50S ribosomal protein L3 [Candidatus Sungbacteria bacterium RIFCSPLOWO2_02_FULL_54_10]|uniref:Large ribosomal subunit protein uL3 n=2 Tax=Candidatus Sungiibacteriota TaxID=1817917 RepID=A0A1G2LBM1_9BACT|nr:MAG: 50S ribosomal protein L3 [Candidatus Sungbacteria bacterium RIFCSPHIGHO2_01_FULL_54_26]OHA02783.1 MAG: 50S ribosomal protein L3 [Candidatus Sungbacteria bacterium RIFCSPHIGHO2_02_FULL_53_17]OHA08192.1 MAG: 50S ribosomal protein L3 [Candidatus Sungbacteria bacterium RIFCSPLOWO2_01_FULL_54_21]OHA12612.1 MAG: 50S ribosomal protein L3 [Candidatus Sungbacteria bacterium RIFCSPLOWO2_02_FULL_54_10]
MKFVLGEKIGMSQLFDAEGRAVPVTLVRATPNSVVGIKTAEKHGYTAVQVGAGVRREKLIAKPQRGQFGDLGNFRYVREFRVPNTDGIQRGDKIDVTAFQEGDAVKVSGLSKAKGFQGVVKRHGFHGAPATHGTKHAHREPGSIGGGGGRAGGRVAKGIRMAGRMGGERVTVGNLRIAKIDAAHNMLAIRGAVPGRRGTLLEVRG